MGYLRLSRLQVPEHVQRATKIFRYNHRVFIAPPWKEIFAQDRERKQDFEEAVRTYETMVLTYKECGYELIELPRAPIAQRLEFVLRSS